MSWGVVCPPAGRRNDRLREAMSGKPAAMKLPSARGPVSDALVRVLSGDPDGLPATPLFADDDDLHLTLFIAYELAYRGWDGVDDRWEWDPAVLRLRAAA